MSTTENSEFAVPEVVADEKEESKEIKATKRPAEVSRNTKPIENRTIFGISNSPYLRRCGSEKGAEVDNNNRSMLQRSCLNVRENLQ